MLVIWEDCTIGVGKEPTGGVTLKFGNIEGLPNIDILVPVTKDTAKDLFNGMAEVMGPRVVLADLNDMKKETRDAGLGTTDS